MKEIMKRFTQHNKLSSKEERKASSKHAPGDCCFEESIFLAVQRVAVISELQLSVFGEALSLALSDFVRQRALR